MQKYEKPEVSGGQGDIYLVRNGNELLINKRPKSKTDDGIIAEEAKNIKLVNPDNKSPNLISMFGMDEKGGIVLEFMNCGNVLEFINASSEKKEYVSLKCYLAIILHALEGLASIHNKNFILIDFKGENILLHFNGDQAKVKMCDFGSMAPLNTDFEDYYQKASILYNELNFETPAKASPTVDLYSFGVFLKEILDGKKTKMQGRRLDDEAVKAINEKHQKILSEIKISPQDVENEKIILQALADLHHRCTGEEDARPQSTNEVIKILEECIKKVGGLAEIDKSLKETLEKYYKSRKPLPQLDTLPQIKFQTENGSSNEVKNNGSAPTQSSDVSHGTAKQSQSESDHLLSNARFVLMSDRRHIPPPVGLITGEVNLYF